MFALKFMMNKSKCPNTDVLVLVSHFTTIAAWCHHAKGLRTFLISSSVAFLKSCSKGLVSSLNRPTSSQFFKKRVGVGVWSAQKNQSDKPLLPSPRTSNKGKEICDLLTSDDDTITTRWTEPECHLMLMFVDRQMVFICESLWEQHQAHFSQTSF